MITFTRRPRVCVWGGGLHDFHGGISECFRDHDVSKGFVDSQLKSDEGNSITSMRKLCKSK